MFESLHDMFDGHGPDNADAPGASEDYSDFFPADLDGDGVMDGILLDADGDGVLDSMLIDTDGDGTYESMLIDADGDGTFETVLIDTDEDGVFETALVETEEDTDGDGVLDTVRTEIVRDEDHDGEFDSDSIAVAQDTDGEPDTIYLAEDYDGDGVLDAIHAYQDTDGDGVWNLADNLLAGESQTYQPFDPEQADMSMISGNPAEDMMNWHTQESSSSCAVASQQFVLEKLMNNEYSEQELRNFAEENGWYTLDGGTPFYDVGNILESAGLHVVRSEGNTIEDLERALENNSGIVVGVDSSELVTGENDDMFFPGMEADHAVQVIGIDHSEPDAPMVILNDPGVSNGGGAMVPLDIFMDAWEDSGYFMVEATAAVSSVPA